MRFKFVAFLLVATLWLNAGIRKETQTAYVQKFKNKAMFLKAPVRGLRQIIHVKDTGVVLDRTNAAEAVAFKVGDQVRITDVNFGDDRIRFKVASIDLSKESEIIFQFSSELREEFTQQRSFDSALASTFTEGLHYAEIDSAKETFIKDQYDQLIQQFSATTGSSPDFVIKAISEKNPEYAAAKRELAEARDKLQDLSGDLNDQVKARRALESQVQQLRTELSQNKSAVETLRAERQRLANQRESQEQQIAQLQKKNQEYDRQVNQLFKNLDTKVTANADLGKRVEVLSTSIDSLKSERTSLSQKLGQLGKELEKLRKSNEELTSGLKGAKEESSKLTSDLRALTSNKNSLEARYLATQRQKEVLERAAALGQALRLSRRIEKRKEGRFSVADLYLLSKKIGTFEMPAPARTGEIYPLRFSADSPDTVHFTDQERRLYGALGDKIQMRASWTSSSSQLKAVLLEKETLQRVRPRENIEWPWIFQGEIGQPEKAILHLELTNADGQTVAIDPQEFTVAPAGLFAQVRNYLSPIPLAAGLVLGFAVFGLLFGFKGRAQAEAAPAARRAGYVAEKKL